MTTNILSPNGAHSKFDAATILLILKNCSNNQIGQNESSTAEVQSFVAITLTELVRIQFAGGIGIN